MIAGKPVVITAVDMRARGFPPLEISFDLTGSSLMCHLFPGGDTVLSMGGPPGGPSHFSITLLRAEPGKAPPSLETRIKSEHDRAGQNFILGPAGEIELAGEKRAAFSWSIKPTPWLDSRAGTFVPLSGNLGTLFVQFSATHDKERGILPAQPQSFVVKSLKVVLKNP